MPFGRGKGKRCKSFSHVKRKDFHIGRFSQVSLDLFFLPMIVAGIGVNITLDISGTAKIFRGMDQFFVSSDPLPLPSGP